MSGRLIKGTPILLSKFDFTKLPYDNQLKGLRALPAQKEASDNLNSMPDWVSLETKTIYNTSLVYISPKSEKNT